MSAGGSQLLCAHYCTMSFCVCLDWPKVCTCAHQCTTSVCVCLEGPIWYVLSNAPLLSGGAQFCFPVLTTAPCLLCLPEGPNCMCSLLFTNVSVCFPVLNDAPCLMCLPEGPNLEGPNSVSLCSPMHVVLLCLPGGSQLVYAHYCTIYF